MRIQHNIMAMNAYRNYTNNVSAMKKNLEKLSSGYKINRAGDDAAGLAISEKMRAQITGLETAQKNAKDGISLVQTAEGALTEVHDMLNRMVELATQSANGTYDDTTDRAQLQKEMNELRKEIDRIADSSNFNGINLLDGSMAQGGGGTSVTGLDRMLADTLGAADDPVKMTGIKTILDGGENGSKKTKFDVDFTGISAGKGDAPTSPVGAVSKTDGVAAGTVTLTNGGLTVANATEGTAGSKASIEVSLANNVKMDKAGTLTITIGGQTLTSGAIATADINDASKIAAAFDGKTVQLGGQAATVAVTGTKLTITADADGVSTGVAAINTATMTGTTAATKGSTVVDFTGKTGLDVLGGVVEVGGTKFEFVKAGKTPATTGATAVEIGETDNAQAIATALSAKVNAATINNVAQDSTATAGKLTINSSVAAGAASTAPAVTAGNAPGRNAKITFKLNNVDMATDVELEGDNKTATDIATAVFGALTDINAGTPGTQVQVNGANYTVTDNGNGKLTFELLDPPTAANVKGDFDWDLSMKDNSGKFDGNHTAGTTVQTAGNVGAANAIANTVFEIKAADIKDGTKITIDGTTVTLAVGPNSKIATKDADGNAKADVVDLTRMETVDIDQALGKISEAFKDHERWVVGVNNKANGDLKQGLTVHKNTANNTDVYDTREKLGAIFGLTTEGNGKSLTLQIGDTAKDYNQLQVDIQDMHAASLGLDSIKISDQASAATAVDVIKKAINTVSDVRGTLGATQNRLDHTINNLSVMTENIQDAESTIRDVDVAEEMMAYTKNNILIQSAQAMLAQANQVPQGVLQLLQ